MLEDKCVPGSSFNTSKSDERERARGKTQAERVSNRCKKEGQEQKDGNPRSTRNRGYRSGIRKASCSSYILLSAC